jgi:hypothetical protein
MSFSQCANYLLHNQEFYCPVDYTVKNGFLKGIVKGFRV